MKNTRRNDVLKIVAMVTMLIDHIGVLYFGNFADGSLGAQIYIIFRTVGRIAFPIFVYQLALGYRFTHDRQAYRKRLLIFGLISQIPYFFLNRNMEFGFLHFNVILLFWYITYVFETYEKLVDSIKKGRDLSTRLSHLIVLISIIILPGLLSGIIPQFYLSYGTYGILMALMFYIVGQNILKVILGFAVVTIIDWQLTVFFIYMYNILYEGAILSYSQIWRMMIDDNALVKLQGSFFQTRSFLALVFIIGLEIFKPKFKMDRRIGYYFYPTHISILEIIRAFISI